MTDAELAELAEWAHTELTRIADQVEHAITVTEPALQEWIIAEVAARLIQRHRLITVGSLEATIRTQLVLSQQRRTLQPWTPSTAPKASAEPTPD